MYKDYFANNKVLRSLILSSNCCKKTKQKKNTSVNCTDFLKNGCAPKGELQSSEIKRERNKGGEKKTAPVVILAESFPVSHWGTGEFHTHTLVAYTGTRGWYSITAHYHLYLALFALLRAYTYKHTCTQLLTIQANHRHHGNSLLATGKADAWSESNTEHSRELWRENATEIQLQKMSSLDSYT